ncbi:D-inositol 3-phosphate glycosyltransferase-like isoform X3 [Pocillopora verrucosa]|uniref:D-inositol 3-phosphate glycosyltransferase-like isoform X3 n=1 Tax=Pocillopora verrucosa TaxID=203993 RepID=UPI00334129C6
MKITLMIEEWRQSTKGGRSTLMRQMAIELSRLENIEVCILIPSASPEDKEDAQRYNIKVFEPEKYSGYEPIDRLPFLPKGFSTDIIIGYGIKPGCHGQVFKNNHGYKWVHVVLRNARETALFQTADSAISEGQKQHETEIDLCENADMVLTVGSKLNETFNSALRQCQKDRIFKLTPGIFNETFGVQKKCRDSKTFEILVFGRGNTEDFEHKGLHVAAKAVRDLNKCEPFYNLKVVGAPEGEQEKLAESLGKCGISRNHLIVRSFNKERTNLAQLFSEVDLVLMPSGTGAFGLTALEALSACVPILINHDSGLAEALEEVTFGHACIVDQADDWVVPIKRAREHRKTRLEEARMLRDMYEKKYCWGDQCAAFVKRLRALLSGHAEEMQQEFQGRTRSARKRVAGHAEEMQQESQGKRSSAQKRVAGHAEEMQQKSQGKRSSAKKRVAGIMTHLSIFKTCPWVIKVGHAKEMQQKSQGKRSSATKRVAASGSTKVNPEKERGSAGKERKLHSGVSRIRFKEGEVTDDDLQTLGKAIASKWDRLARQLPKITECDIEEIEDSHKTLSQRGFHMLRLWKTNNGAAADYKTLHDALVHNMVQRKDLAEKLCVK